MVKLVDEWVFSSTDLAIIKRDWETIRQKVVEGRAHELSEGDTFYLGVCTKGGKGGNPREQPRSDILAKQRAYSLKQSYVNHIIASISQDIEGKYGKLVPSPEVAQSQTIDEIVLSRFEHYYGQTADEIMAETGIDLNREVKNFYANLTKAILGIDPEKEIEEFEKAGIVGGFIKTVRLNANNLPQESISFPAFKFEELLQEDWGTSEFKQLLEHKFLFNFFQFEGGRGDQQLVLKKVAFWNMPYQDIQTAKEVWDKTREIIAAGTIVREIKREAGKDIRKTYFPGKKSNPILHVRPHAQNAQDTYPLPVKDALTGDNAYTKQSFWLNDTYVRDAIFLP